MRRENLAFLLLLCACSGTGQQAERNPSGAAGRVGGGAVSVSGAGPKAGDGSGGALGGAAGVASVTGGGEASAGSADTAPDVSKPFAPAVGKTALLIGQSGRRAHLDYVLGTGSVPAGGSVYAELYSGKFLSFEQTAFVDYLAESYPGSLVEVGLSWKDNRVNAGFCDLADAACVASGGAIAPELALVAGKYDAALLSFAHELQARATLRFLVRVDYEVSPGMHCAPSDQQGCPAYVDAFRYVKARLMDAGVENAELVFHPTRGFARQMYPGAEVTDWIAFSVFNHDLCLPTPEGTNGGCAPGAHLDENLAKDLEWAGQQGKPILVAESTVQSPSDTTPAGFNEYLGRLFELVEQRPQVRGLTYINMEWGGGWIYGENWTVGAFGNVDARLSRYPETRAYFCRKLASGRYVAGQGRTLGCDAAAVAIPQSLPPDPDAPSFERAVLLGSNLCVQALAGKIVQSVCRGREATGQLRLRIAESTSGARLWSDSSWRCWSVAGDAVTESPCSAAPEQSFELRVSATGPGYRDVTLRSHDGRCVAALDELPDSPLRLLPCDSSPQQTFRL